MPLSFGEPFRLFNVRVRGQRRQTSSRKRADELAAELSSPGSPATITPSRTYYAIEYSPAAPKGRRISTGCHTKFEARAWVAARLQKGSAVSKRRGKVLLDEALEAWIADLELKRRSKKTVGDYRVQIGFWKQHLGNPRVSAITSDDISAFFSARASGALGGRLRDEKRRKKWKPSERLLNLNLVLFRAFFVFCASEERQWCDLDPSRFIKPWREPVKEPRVLTPEEVTRLLAACRDKYTVTNRREGFREYTTEQEYLPPPYLYPLVLVGLLTMLRFRNLVNLAWKHVDFQRKLITIPARELKGRRDLELPMSPALRSCLLELRANSDSRLVFGTSLGSVRRSFQSAVKRAKIPGAVTMHTLRKSAANFLRQSGAPLEVVERLGAWAGPEVLLKHYRNPDDKEIRQAAKKLDKLVGRKGGKRTKRKGGAGA